MLRRARTSMLTVFLVALLAWQGSAARPISTRDRATITQAQRLEYLRRKREAPILNDRPIIGILSQPGEPAPEKMSYIAASYVKWLEAAGARVVPILYDMSNDEITRRFKALNGVLLPGGGATLTPGHRFFDVVRLLVDLAVEANEKGDYFPIHGTCLGMEALSVALSQNYTILSPFDAEDAAAPLLYTEFAKDSHLFSQMPKDVVQALQNTPIAMENHMMGLSMAAYTQNTKLSDFLTVLSLSVDKSGNPYVSSLESPKYPFTALQWHPEKNAFEWTTNLHIPHSPEAVRMTQEVANFFVSETRRNQHKPTTNEEEQDMLIYNWKPFYTGKKHGDGEETDFEQAYFFDINTPPSA